MNRASGVLMHVSSLHGEYSIGSFGAEARQFVDFLANGGFSYWQVLPFCMADDCNSPYKSYSAFGGNPFFIDLPTLFKKGLLTLAELDEARQKAPYLCEYSRLSEERLPLLRFAASRVDEAGRSAVAECMKKYPELEEAAHFLSLREANGGKRWQDFTVDTPDESELFFWQFVQCEFLTQWLEVKAYANSKGVKIIGDIPIYVALDS